MKETNDMGRHFISLKEAAHYLDMSYVRLWERIGKKNGPPAQKIGGRWKIPKDKFIEWAKQPVIP